MRSDARRVGGIVGKVGIVGETIKSTTETLDKRRPHDSNTRMPTRSACRSHDERGVPVNQSALRLTRRLRLERTRRSR